MLPAARKEFYDDVIWGQKDYRGWPQHICLDLNHFPNGFRCGTGSQACRSPKKKAAPPWMAAENLLASFFYFISVFAEMGIPPHMGGELKPHMEVTGKRFEVRNRRGKARISSFGF
jgi:hypothetical protein